jgi:hypothetical protein
MTTKPTKIATAQFSDEDLLRQVQKEAGMSDEAIDALAVADPVKPTFIVESDEERIRKLEAQLLAMGVQPVEVEEIVPPEEDPYYDWSKAPKIEHAVRAASAATQRMHLQFKDAAFSKRFQAQWCYEYEIGRMLQMGYQFVRPEWVITGVASGTAGVIPSASDKIRIPSSRVHESTHDPLYLVAMCIPKKMLAQIEKARQDEYRRTTAKHNAKITQHAKQAGFDTSKFSL